MFIYTKIFKLSYVIALFIYCTEVLELTFAHWSPHVALCNILPIFNFLVFFCLKHTQADVLIL